MTILMVMWESAIFLTRKLEFDASIRLSVDRVACKALEIYRVAILIRILDFVGNECVIHGGHHHVIAFHRLAFRCCDDGT
jgi:hypothetical protein